MQTTRHRPGTAKFGFTSAEIGKNLPCVILSFLLESRFRILDGFLVIGEVDIIISTMGDDIQICLNSLDQVTLYPRLVKLCPMDTPETLLNLEVKGVIVTARV